MERKRGAALATIVSALTLFLPAVISLPPLVSETPVHGSPVLGQNVTTRGPGDGPLLVFLGGTGSSPGDYSRFLAVAADEGFHVIGLAYADSGPSVSSTCLGRSDCYGLLEGNRFDGRTPSRFSDVAAEQTVRARLLQTLRRLAADDPQGHWQRFLGGTAVHPALAWRDIVLAGHSQGSGIAAFIAHEHRVRGLVTLGGPILTDGSHPATWAGTPGATPAADMVAFASRSDVYFTRIVSSWNRLGLPDDTDHRSITDVDLGPPAIAHSAVVADRGPSDEAGSPAFAPIWRRMLERVSSTGDGLSPT